MNGQTPNVIQPEQPAKKGSIFKLIFVIVFLIILSGVLNYFNILPISNLWPNQFGFLPIQKSKQPARSTGRLNNAPPLKLSCPSVKVFCEKGEGISKDGAYVGIGYKLSSGSAIFAAFDGDLTATFSAYPVEVNGKPTLEKFAVLYLDNTGLGLRGIYFFKGPKEKIKKGQVFKGQQIAEVGGKPIVTYDFNSLIFSLIPGYPRSNTPAILNKEDFE